MLNQEFDLEEMFEKSFLNGSASSVTQSLELFKNYFAFGEEPLSSFHELDSFNFNRDITQSMIEIISTQYEKIRETDYTNELDHVQPVVQEFVQSAIRCFDGRLPSGSRIYTKGSKFPSTKKPPSIEDYKHCRVYCPYSGIPDIEISISIDSKEGTSPSTRSQSRPTFFKLPPDPSLQIDCANPPAEIKPDIIAWKNDTKQAVQAAAYGTRLMLRTFPMLPEEHLLRIFPGRVVFVPLMSHKELLLLRVNPWDTCFPKIRVDIAGPFIGDAYIHALLLWTN